MAQSFVNPFWKACGAYPKTAPYQSGIDAKHSASDIDWLYGKIAYASAAASGPGGKAGLDVAGWSNKFSDGTGAWYKSNATDKSTHEVNEEKDKSSQPEEFTTPVYIPKAHITSITITSDPNTMGSVRTCKVSFQTYNKGQLNALKAFFVPGNTLTATIGWDGRLSTSDKAETFTGEIFNFNINLKPDGGYEATSEAIGKGNNVVLNIKVDSAIPVTSPELTDSNGTVLPDINIFSEFQKIAQDAQGKSKGKATLAGKYPAVVSELPENHEPSKQGSSSDNQSTSKKRGYVTVEEIRKLTNEILTHYCKASGIQIEWPSNPKYAQTNVFSEIVSADPTRLLVNNDDYGKGSITNNGMDKAITGTTIDAKNIYICVDWLIEQSKINYVDQDRDKKVSLKIGDFWKKIFDLIKQTLGESLELTFVHNADKSANDKNIYIVDINAIDKVDPVTIDSAGSANWTRSVTLSSNLTSEVSTAFYVDNQAPAAAKAGRGGEFLKFISGKAGETKEDPAKWTKAKTAVGDNPNDGNISALASSNKERVLFVKNTMPSSLLVPFELTVVLEGTTGFEYGDAIKSSFVPSIYNTGANGVNVGFFITQVEHNVADGDWTTTLSTKCRLYT